jgi:hypothetical protein
MFLTRCIPMTWVDSIMTRSSGRFLRCVHPNTAPRQGWVFDIGHACRAFSRVAAGALLGLVFPRAEGLGAPLLYPSPPCSVRGKGTRDPDQQGYPSWLPRDFADRGTS